MTIQSITQKVLTDNSLRGKMFGRANDEHNFAIDENDILIQLDNGGEKICSYFMLADDLLADDWEFRGLAFG